MIDHWNAGYNDAIRTLRHPEALQRPTDQTGVATFDVAVDGREWDDAIPPRPQIRRSTA
jgi:NTE family protein